MKSNRVVVLDLDDTLYKEIDFLKSAYHEIAGILRHPEAYDFMFECYVSGENPFARAIEQYKSTLSVDQLLGIYRNHKPRLTLDSSVADTLSKLREQGIPICILTDGRSVTQRNKIEVLRLGEWVDEENIIISEEFGYGKPDIRCYKYFIERYPDAAFFCVGDNTSKDFVTPNSLGWITICLIDNGLNVHSQDFTLLPKYLPNFRIQHFNEILSIL